MAPPKQSKAPTEGQDGFHKHGHFINIGLPFPVRCTPYEEVNCTAKMLAARVFRHHQRLLNILERYELLLRKRWIKKSQQQKRTLLLKAAPNMPKYHRPDVRSVHRRVLSKEKSTINEWPDHFLLPAINLEDLSISSRNLLLFLYSRGRQLPGLFIITDFDSVRVGLEVNGPAIPHVHGHTMHFDGQTVEDYGRLTCWGTDDDMRSKIKSGHGVVPGIGVLIMTIQERTLSFLLTCAALILHDLPLEDSSVPLQPNPGEVTSENETEWGSLSVEVLEAAYRVPPKFDVSRLQSFVFAKRAECLDDIWALREDPLHFKESLLEWGDHRGEQVRSADGVKCLGLDKESWWEQVVQAMVIDVYSSFHCWDLIARHVEKLLSLKDEAYQSDQIDSKVSRDYEYAIAYLEFAVIQAMTRPLMKWRDGLASSPPLRKHFVLDLETGKVHPKVDWHKEKDKFLWLLQIPLHDRQIDHFGTWKVMDSLNCMMSTAPQEKHRITPWIATLISEMSLLSELSRQSHLLSNRPLMAEKQNEYVQEKRAQLDKETSNISEMYWVFRQNIKVVQHITPFDNLNYPYHKRRTATTTKAMQQAEQTLDSFWGHLDAEFVRLKGKKLHQVFGGAIEVRELARTSDWSEEDRSPPTKPIDIQSTDIREALRELELRSESTIGQATTPIPRTKLKTRGSASEPFSKQTADAGIQQQPDPVLEEPKIKVSKRALAVFSTIFFTGFHGDNPGEIPWTEFLHAMASAGFTNKKLDGSAWIFAPMDDDFRRSIIFHEPHPVSKIPFRNARRMGRRLDRAFGWTGETFERA